MNTLFRSMLFLFFALFSAKGSAQLIPQLTDIPDHFSSKQKAIFSDKKNLLLEKKDALKDMAARLSVKCGNVPAIDIDLNNQCKAEQSQIIKEKSALIDAINEFNKAVSNEPVTEKVDEPRLTIGVDEERIRSMTKLAAKLGWSSKEQARLSKALNTLDKDGSLGTTVGQGYNVWTNMQARENDLALKQQASKVGGVGYPGAGTQSTNDCTIFALANAAGIPYGVAAARAAKLISEGEWRDPSERANPEIVFKKGLNGHEVIMLAEAFGQAEVVPSTAFVATLIKAHPILLGVVLTEKEKDNSYSQYLHEVVLTKTFKYKGETWFEMMDSNQPATVRHYLTRKELGIIMFENGVAFHPDRGTVPISLK